MIQYWLGDYAEGKFDLQGADGPFPLDLGDIMYAPNVLTDKHVSAHEDKGTVVVYSVLSPVLAAFSLFDVDCGGLVNRPLCSHLCCHFIITQAATYQRVRTSCCSA